MIAQTAIMILSEHMNIGKLKRGERQHDSRTRILTILSGSIYALSLYRPFY